MKKQTALNWMMENLPPSATIKTSEILEYYKIKQKAKEMEKQQIKDAFNSGMVNSIDWFIDGTTEEAEQYYKETYD